MNNTNNNKALIVGGSSGLGLSIALTLTKKYNQVIVADCKDLDLSYIKECIGEDLARKIEFIKVNLFSKELDSLRKYVDDIETLIITAGFGRVASFFDLQEVEVNKLMQVNMVSPIKILKMFYNRIHSNDDFYVAVIGSIAGHITSPLFSVYGAAKSGLCAFIKNVNVELIASGFKNRILDVSPGSFGGSSFRGDKSDIRQLSHLSSLIIDKMFSREILLIPKYEETFKDIIERDFKDPIKFGLDSLNYKLANSRVSSKPQVIIGYLSGTFDLFHIGHLNLLRQAKQNCDYLIVGVHESGAWKNKETFIPFDERLAIVNACEYVDEAHVSCKEDSDAWLLYHYDKLFVGSDYKGSERFKRYEQFFLDKNVKIVYFPYTKGTSSTELRKKIKE